MRRAPSERGQSRALTATGKAGVRSTEEEDAEEEASLSLGAPLGLQGGEEALRLPPLGDVLTAL